MSNGWYHGKSGDKRERKLPSSRREDAGREFPFFPRYRRPTRRQRQGVRQRVQVKKRRGEMRRTVTDGANLDGAAARNFTVSHTLFYYYTLDQPTFAELFISRLLDAIYFYNPPLITSLMKTYRTGERSEVT